MFARARENARRSACQSNLKQIGLGILQYSQDYDERFPSGVWSDLRGTGWGGQIYPYVKNVQIFKCPSDRFTSTFISANANTSTGNNFAPTYTCSYYYNPNFSGVTPYATPYNNTPGSPLNHSQLTSAARTVLSWESTQTVIYLNPEGEGLENASPASNGYDHRGGVPATGELDGGYKGFSTNALAAGVNSIARHLEGANYLAADGHVKWFKSEKISAGRTCWGTTGAQSTGNAPGSECATYSGSDAHALTMSPR